MNGIVLDVDGTLWDSVDLAVRAWNEMLAKRNLADLNVSRNQLTSNFGKPVDVIMANLFPMLSEKEREELSAECIMRENEILQKESGIIYPGVAKTIKKMSSTTPLFIVSNCQKGYIENCMRWIGIENSITDYACYADEGKPKNENIKLIIERNHLDRAVYVGDTQSDADACKLIGVPIVFASYGFGIIEKPDFVIDNFEQLTELFLFS